MTNNRFDKTSGGCIKVYPHPIAMTPPKLKTPEAKLPAF
jgi:hypothetical protein